MWTRVTLEKKKDEDILFYSILKYSKADVSGVSPSSERANDEGLTKADSDEGLSLEM